MHKTKSNQGYAGRKKISFLLLGAFLLSGISGCVYERTQDCPQGIDLRLYSKTPCLDTVYPRLSGLDLRVFDRRGKLVSYRQSGDSVITEHYAGRLEAENGLYSVTAWAGLDADAFERGSGDEKSGLLFRLKRSGGRASSLEGKRIYYGESPVVFLPDPAEYGSVFEPAAINLREITNRLTIQVEGLPLTGDYEAVVESANGSINTDGSIASDDRIEYGSQAAFTDGLLEARLTVLKLATGYNTSLVIRNRADNSELYRGDLLGTLLLKNPAVNLDCDHDFTIRFTAKDQCSCGTYMIMEIWVNNWLVHSYTTDL
ncbi:FimB/Mfa2 family fimbrial subunit [Dysgonomonas sp. GY75]|uniref:FimB/Mfa2 family fimbrial subunit n=1 Tax=Dysgonomonas sp. GY75 TaxID=2780419 RepID=UPI001884631C|nr:FimB/Mfa2 family fimbrial subunit [Dysgonomonas sp. GY75]MBF0651968.1 FimB/Mfa2 family fimbrial subunit [Dysgonomonas sp. GY75]